MRIDLNSDLGEHYGVWRSGEDAAMLDVVSSANVACGFHAGDPRSMLETLQEAARRGVSVGAHVSYPDLRGFGRRPMHLDDDEIATDVAYQLGALQGLARMAGASVAYVKPHGALYNVIAHDERQASAVIRAVSAVDAGLPLVCLAGSPLIGWAEAAGLRAVPEAFADRAYEPDGSLVPRSEAGAVIQDVDLVLDRMVRLAREGVIEAGDGSDVPVRAESICVHSDTAEAVSMARALRDRLTAEGIEIRSFVGAP